MNRRTTKAALEIQLLLQEYSAAEISDALSMVGGREGEDLLGFLARTASLSPERRQRQSVGKHGGLSSTGETRALQELKDTNPDKYEVLKEFEGKIRAGVILSTLDDFREFGKSLGKAYKPAKSRKEALGQLMGVLAQMQLEELREAIAKAQIARSRDEEAYGRLAEHIITGGRPPEP